MRTPLGSIVAAWALLASGCDESTSSGSLPDGGTPDAAPADLAADDADEPQPDAEAPDAGSEDVLRPLDGGCVQPNLPARPMLEALTPPGGRRS